VIGVGVGEAPVVLAVCFRCHKRKEVDQRYELQVRSGRSWQLAVDRRKQRKALESTTKIEDSLVLERHKELGCFCCAERPRWPTEDLLRTQTQGQGNSGGSLCHVSRPAPTASRKQQAASSKQQAASSNSKCIPKCQ
jgi:hypothetical protein